MRKKQKIILPDSAEHEEVEDMENETDSPAFSAGAELGKKALEQGDSFNFSLLGDWETILMPGQSNPPTGLTCDIKVFNLDDQKEEILTVPSKIYMEMVSAINAVYVDENEKWYDYLEAGLEFNLARTGILTYKLSPTVEEGLQLRGRVGD